MASSSDGWWRTGGGRLGGSGRVRASVAMREMKGIGVAGWGWWLAAADGDWGMVEWVCLGFPPAHLCPPPLGHLSANTRVIGHHCASLPVMLYTESLLYVVHVSYIVLHRWNDVDQM